MKPLVLTLTLLFCTALAGGTELRTVTFKNRISPDRSYEGNTTLFIQSFSPNTRLQDQHWFIFGTTGGANPNIRRAMLAFNISRLPQDAVIESVSLKVFARDKHSSGNANSYVETHLTGMTDGFDPQKSTWNTTAGDYSGEILSRRVANPSLFNHVDTLEYPSTPEFVDYVQQALTDPEAKHTVYLMLKLPDKMEIGVGWYTFSLEGARTSRAKSTGSERPELTITYRTEN